MDFSPKTAPLPNACSEAGLTFIGPDAECIARMGDKVAARQTAAAIGIPVVPGSEHGFTSAAPANEVAQRLGFPLLLKASGGGGGRGMRIVNRAEDLLRSSIRPRPKHRQRSETPKSILSGSSPRSATSKSRSLATSHGNYVHLGERDCSVQRRHQKLVEESPSPALDQPRAAAWRKRRSL